MSATLTVSFTHPKAKMSSTNMLTGELIQMWIPFLLCLSDYAHGLIEVTTITVKPVRVSETLWNTEMITTSYSANEK